MGHPTFFPAKVSLAKDPLAVHDFASSGTDHIRVPIPLHTTGEKTTTTSPALSSSPQRAAEPHLETAGRQQLTGNQAQKKKKAQSVPGRVRRLERRGRGTDRKLKSERAQARNRQKRRRPSGQEREKTWKTGVKAQHGPERGVRPPLGLFSFPSAPHIATLLL